MATSTRGKPNILFVMADDVGWFNVGAVKEQIVQAMKSHHGQ